MNLDNVTIPTGVDVRFIQKKFYNKYIYKLEFNTKLPKMSMAAASGNKYSYYVRSSTAPIRQLTQQLANTIERIITDKDCRFRVECNSLTFFTNNEQDVIKLIASNTEKLVAVYRPSSQEHINTIELNKRIRVRNILFDNRFKYKVYLGNIYKMKETKFAEIKAWAEVTENPDGTRWGTNGNLHRYLNLKPDEQGRGIGWTIAVFLNEPEDLMMFQLRFHNYISYIEEAVLLSEL
jgi:hypothetical protein